MTREPKDYEIWYVKLPDGSIKPAVAFIPPNPKNTVWYIDGDTCCADPIAPVISHKLAREMLVALTMTEHLYQRGILFVNKSIYDEVHNSRKSVLTKAKLAGLDVPHD